MIPNFSYIYTDRLRLKDETVIEIWAFAQMRYIPRISTMCEKYLKAHLDPSNAIGICSRAFQTNVGTDLCFHFLAKNISSVLTLKSDEFVQLDTQTFEGFLGHMYNYFSDKEATDDFFFTQLLIFKTTLRWVHHRTTRDFTQFMKLLKHFWPSLHVTMISPGDFAHCLVEVGLFQRATVDDVYRSCGYFLTEMKSSPHPQCLSCRNSGYSESHGKRKFCSLDCEGSQVATLKEFFQDRFATLHLTWKRRRLGEETPNALPLPLPPVLPSISTLEGEPLVNRFVSLFTRFTLQQ